MYGYYIIIKGLKKLSKVDEKEFIELLEGMMIKPTIKIDDDFLIAIDVIKDADVSFEAFIVAVNGDFLTDLKLYESVMFTSKALLSENLEANLQKELFVSTYNNDKTILYNKISNYVDEDFKKDIFKSLYNDLEFLRSIKIYLENDKNTSKAAIEANLHRNTMDNRLLKFFDVTGYDLRKFDDSVFIYLLLKDIN